MAIRRSEQAVANIYGFKANPMNVALNTKGCATAILNLDKPVFYCIPAETYELIINHIEDLELLSLAEERKHQVTFKVNLTDL